MFFRMLLTFILFSLSLLSLYFFIFPFLYRYFSMFFFFVSLCTCHKLSCYIFLLFELFLPQTILFHPCLLFFLRTALFFCLIYQKEFFLRCKKTGIYVSRETYMPVPLNLCLFKQKIFFTVLFLFDLYSAVAYFNISAYFFIIFFILCISLLHLLRSAFINAMHNSV